jgi:hypothetical protein
LDRWREELGSEQNINVDAALRKRIELYLDQGYGECDHFENVITYIEDNPVKAHLCEKPEDWPFSSAWFRKKGKR